LARTGNGVFGLPARVRFGAALAFDAAKVIEGAEVSALEGGDASGDFVKEPGGGGIEEDGDLEVFGTGAFVEKSTVEPGFDALETTLLPVGTDQDFDVEVLDGDWGWNWRW
jgi:hypothetical protein